MSMTYAGTGVNYDVMDPFKRMAQQAARETTDNISRLNGGEFREFEPSRGESAYLIEAAAEKVLRTAQEFDYNNCFVAGHIEEGDKKVVIKPLDLEFAGETLAVR